VNSHATDSLEPGPATPVANGPKDFFETRPQTARAGTALEPVAFKAEPELVSALDTANSFDVPVTDDGEPAFEPVAIANCTAPDNEDEETLQRCVADIHDQLVAVPAKNSPTVSAITLGGCKLLIATWEAEAFIQPTGDPSAALQRTVAARTILHVCMERHRKGEPTDLDFALLMARKQTQEMEAQIALAKEANNIDAAVNLAATTKRLMALIDEGEKLNA